MAEEHKISPLAQEIVARPEFKQYDARVVDAMIRATQSYLISNKKNKDNDFKSSAKTSIKSIEQGKFIKTAQGLADQIIAIIKSRDTLEGKIAKLAFNIGSSAENDTKEIKKIIEEEKEKYWDRLNKNLSTLSDATKQMRINELIEGHSVEDEQKIEQEEKKKLDEEISAKRLEFEQTFTIENLLEILKIARDKIKNPETKIDLQQKTGTFKYVLENASRVISSGGIAQEIVDTAEKLNEAAKAAEADAKNLLKQGVQQLAAVAAAIQPKPQPEAPKEEKIPWYKNKSFHIGLVVTGAILFTGACILFPPLGIVSLTGLLASAYLVAADVALLTIMAGIGLAWAAEKDTHAWKNFCQKYPVASGLIIGLGAIFGIASLILLPLMLLKVGPLAFLSKSGLSLFETATVGAGIGTGAATLTGAVAARDVHVGRDEVEKIPQEGVAVNQDDVAQPIPAAKPQLLAAGAQPASQPELPGVPVARAVEPKGT